MEVSHEQNGCAKAVWVRTSGNEARSVLPTPASALCWLASKRCLKALHTFHFRDANTALINLGRVIYTFKRQ